MQFWVLTAIIVCPAGLVLRVVLEGSPCLEEYGRVLVDELGEYPHYLQSIPLVLGGAAV